MSPRKPTGLRGLGLAGLGGILGAGADAGASVAGVYSTPEPHTRMEGEKTYGTDIGLGFDVDTEGELMANPAGMEAVRRREKEGRSFPTWYPVTTVNENNMMNAWLAEQAKKAELTTTKMQQKRLGIAESAIDGAIDAAGKAAGNAIGVVRKKQPWENNRLVTFDKYHKDEQQKEKLKNRLKPRRRLQIDSDPRDLHPNEIPIDDEYVS